MGDLVNLRRRRKAKARREAEMTAEANRLAFGRPKAETALVEARRGLDARRLEAHRRAPPDDALPPDDE